jgi:hypothetical protein
MTKEHKASSTPTQWPLQDEAVVIAANEFKRSKGGLTGQALIDSIQASPSRETDVASARSVMPVRRVDL